MARYQDSLGASYRRPLILILAAAGIVRLDSPLTGDLSDAELVVAALPFFAGELRLAMPDRVEFTLPRQRLPVVVEASAESGD